MKCPVCTATDLMMTERSGIEIDYCPQCRGVWLDRGELDKIIERSPSTGEADRPYREGPAHPQGNHHWGNPDHHEQRLHHDRERSYHGRKSFWQELFD